MNGHIMVSKCSPLDMCCVSQFSKLAVKFKYLKLRKCGLFNLSVYKKHFSDYKHEDLNICANVKIQFRNTYKLVIYSFQNDTKSKLEIQLTLSYIHFFFFVFILFFQRVFQQCHHSCLDLYFHVSPLSLCHSCKLLSCTLDVHNFHRK